MQRENFIYESLAIKQNICFRNDYEPLRHFMKTTYGACRDGSLREHSFSAIMCEMKL